MGDRVSESMLSPLLHLVNDPAVKQTNPAVASIRIPR
jgi:hypothetical protein